MKKKKNNKKVPEGVKHMAVCVSDDSTAIVIEKLISQYAPEGPVIVFTATKREASVLGGAISSE